MEKHVLFTNVKYADIGDLHMAVSAVLLTSRSATTGEPLITLSGFGPDPGWLVFTKRVKTLEHKLVQVTLGDRVSMVSCDLIVGDFALRLGTDDWNHPVQVEAFEGSITDVWDNLHGRVARFWHAPNIPHLTWQRADFVRSISSSKR